MTTERTAAAAGWYPDPLDLGQVRYWDGRDWTEHVTPMAHPAVMARLGPPAGLTGVPGARGGDWA